MKNIAHKHKIKTRQLRIVILMLVAALSLTGNFNTSKASPDFQGYQPLAATNITWSSDGNLLAVDSRAGVWIYDVNDLLQPPSLLGDGIGGLFRMRFSSDNQLMAFGLGDVSIWDLETETQLTFLSIEDVVRHIVFSPDNNLIATTSLGRIFRIWDTTTGNEVAQLPGAYATFKSDWSQVAALGYQEDNPDVIVGWSIDLDQRLFTEVARIPLEERINGPAGLLLSPDDTLLAFSSRRTGNLHLIDTETWTETAVLNAFTDRCTGDHAVNLAFSPDSSTLAASCSFEGTILVWDIANNETVSWETRSGYIVFSPDGSMLAAVEANPELGTFAQIWDIATQTRHAAFQGSDMTFNPNWSLLATIGPDDNVWIWDVERQELRAILTLPGRVSE